MLDVWDASTFDGELTAALASAGTLVRNYVTRENAIFLEYDRQKETRLPMRPANEYASAYLDLSEQLSKLLDCRTIRAWHYCRLTDAEVAALRREGIHVSTPETLRRRLDSLVAGGDLATSVADRLFAASPFQGNQRESRTGKFWFVSHPQTIDDDGVERLLRYWGGEVASFWTDDDDLLRTLSSIGLGRVLEVAVPLASTDHAYSASKAVLATYARSLGCVASSAGFDLFTTKPLSESCVISVHSEGDPSFDKMARGYPDGYIDVNLTHWKDLTGED